MNMENGEGGIVVDGERLQVGDEVEVEVDLLDANGKVKGRIVKKQRIGQGRKRYNKYVSRKSFLGESGSSHVGGRLIKTLIVKAASEPDLVNLLNRFRHEGMPNQDQRPLADYHYRIESDVVNNVFVPKNIYDGDYIGDGRWSNDGDGFIGGFDFSKKRRRVFRKSNLDLYGESGSERHSEKDGAKEGEKDGEKNGEKDGDGGKKGDRKEERRKDEQKGENGDGRKTEGKSGSERDGDKAPKSFGASGGRDDDDSDDESNKKKKSNGTGSNSNDRPRVVDSEAEDEEQVESGRSLTTNENGEGDGTLPRNGSPTPAANASASSDLTLSTQQGPAPKAYNSMSMRESHQLQLFGPDAWHRVDLPCLEIREDGSVRRIKMSRASIMNEARKMLPDSTPTAKVLAGWLSARSDSKEMRRWARKMGFRSNTKGFKKYLKKYLRNSIQPRDIRQIDPAFTPKPALWVRHSALIVSLEIIRGIILRDRMLLFDPDNKRLARAIKFIRKHVRSTQQAGTSLGSFEFKALEGVLMEVVAGLETDFGKLEPRYQDTLEDISSARSSLIASRVQSLRLYKAYLTFYQSRVDRVSRALSEVLDEDEDMANMYLTEKYKRPFKMRTAMDHEEVEVMLESYMQQIADFQHRVHLLQQRAEHDELSTNLHLDTLRNKMLAIDLILIVLGAAFAFGGFISGIFGMNLVNPMSRATASTWWFYGITIFLVVFAFCSVSTAIVLVRRRMLLIQ